MKIFKWHLISDLDLYLEQRYSMKIFKSRIKQLEDNYNCLLKQKEQFEYIMSKQVDYHGQQKEFIEYMNKTIEELECDDVDDEEMKGYLIQRIDTFKEILSKYKEIIKRYQNE